MSNNALYYPYANISNINSLNKAILYFDKIFVINPHVASLHSPNSSELHSGNVSSSIEYISPLDLFEVNEYDNIMCKSVISDLEDKEFEDLCQKPGISRRSRIHIDKIPSLKVDATIRKYFVNIPSIYEGLLAQRLEESGNDTTGMRRRDVYNGMKEYSEQREHNYERRMVELPFVVSESVMINHAILSSALNPRLNKASPFTDDQMHHEVLKFKFTKPERSKAIKYILKEYGYIEDTNVNLAAIDIINNIVPNLENMPLNEIETFREDNRILLIKFRDEIKELSEKIKSEFWDENFHEEVISLVVGIENRIEELKETMENFVNDLRQGIDKTRAIVNHSLISTVTPGIPPQIGIVSNTDIYTFEKFLESDMASKRFLQKNGVAFLLKVRESLV